MTDGLLHDACGVLHTFIHTQSTAWAPIISSVSYFNSACWVIFDTFVAD